MRKITPPLLSLAGGIAVASGLIWIAVQTGKSALNEHLCQFIRLLLEGKYAEPVPPNCPAMDVLLDISGWLLWLCLALLFVTACLEAYDRMGEYKMMIMTTCRSTYSLLPSPYKPTSVGELERASFEVAEVHPDIPLKNTFFYINPDCFGNAGRNALQIGGDIIDELYTGKITAWGRERVKGKECHILKIPREYWKNATFDYSLFCDDNGIQAEPLPGCSGPSYSDVQFNREQIKAAWPKAPGKGAKGRLLSIWRYVKGR